MADFIVTARLINEIAGAISLSATDVVISKKIATTLNELAFLAEERATDHIAAAFCGDDVHSKMFHLKEAGNLWFQSSDQKVVAGNRCSSILMRLIYSMPAKAASFYREAVLAKMMGIVCYQLCFDEDFVRLQTKRLALLFYKKYFVSRERELRIGREIKDRRTHDENLFRSDLNKIIRTLKEEEHIICDFCEKSGMYNWSPISEYDYTISEYTNWRTGDHHFNTTIKRKVYEFPEIG